MYIHIEIPNLEHKSRETHETDPVSEKDPGGIARAPVTSWALGTLPREHPETAPETPRGPTGGRPGYPQEPLRRRLETPRDPWGVSRRLRASKCNIKKLNGLPAGHREQNSICGGQPKENPAPPPRAVSAPSGKPNRLPAGDREQNSICGEEAKEDPSPPPQALSAPCARPNWLPAGDC